jgi:DNA polymerase-3 subunit gamma/tau
MFTGIRGTGKTSIARILGKELGIDPIDIREIDGASNNSIDNIRHLVSQLKIPPMVGK